jgi:hypothetical protein
MNTPTLSQLADIGADAALRHTIGSMLQLYNGCPAYAEDAKAREAFVKAVLDAVGYKFPVDPEREAFDAWLTANPSRSSNDELFEAWKAGRATMLAEQVNHEAVMPHPDSGKSQSETFEAHGLTWIKHTPGDPMPCDGESMLQVLEEGERNGKTYWDFRMPAREWGWRAGPNPTVGWRYADAP